MESDEELRGIILVINDDALAGLAEYMDRMSAMRVPQSWC